MASKRNMYRPAQENVGQRRPRKALAQGRLISSTSLPKLHDSAEKSGLWNDTGAQAPLVDGVMGQIAVLQTFYASPKNFGEAYSCKVVLPSSPLSQSSSHVSNTSGNVSRLHTSLIQGQLEESIFSPRRSVPQASELRPPGHGPPAHNLDLSDSDEFAELPEKKGHQVPADVMCIDASHQTVDLDVSEIDIKIGMDKHPIKIVCHTPVTAHGELVNSRRASQCSPQLQKARPVIKDKLSDSHVDPTTAVQSVPMSPSLGSGQILQSVPLRSYLPQPNFDDTSDSDKTGPFLQADDTIDKGDNMSVISDIVSDHHDDSNMKGVKVIIKKEGSKSGPASRSTRLKVQAASRHIAPGSTKKEPPKRPETDKKKKGKVVPSRYMQGAEAKAKMSLSSRMDKISVMDKTKKISKSMEAPSSTRKPVRKIVRSAETGRTAERKLDVDRPQTPENQSIASSVGGKTSTPTMDGTFVSHEMEIDASAIHPEASLLTGDTSRSGKPLSGSGKTRSRVQQDLRDDLMGQSILSNVSLSNQCTVSLKPKQKTDVKALQQKLDLYWIHNLQWAFLEAKAKKNLEDQERQAMAQIYGIYEEIEKLRKMKAEEEQQLTKVKHMNMIDHLTEIQRQCLGPVINNLPTLKKQHQCLAEALDTTRHQIATKDIHLPDKEDQFQARLEAHLLESERLLGEISVVIRQDSQKITDTANAIVTMEKAVEDMENELKKSRELLAATETLTMHECSLRVQEVQMLN